MREMPASRTGHEQTGGHGENRHETRNAHASRHPRAAGHMANLFSTLQHGQTAPTSPPPPQVGGEIHSRQVKSRESEKKKITIRPSMRARFGRNIIREAWIDRGTWAGREGGTRRIPCWFLYLLGLSVYLHLQAPTGRAVVVLPTPIHEHLGFTGDAYGRLFEAMPG